MRILIISLLLLSPAQEEDPNERIDEFAAKIIVGDNESLKLFKEILESPAGKIVLNDRVDKEGARLRNKAQRDAVPDYIRSHFDVVDGQYRLKKGKDDFRKELADGKKQYDIDMEKVSEVCRDYAENFIEEPKINATVKTFMKNENGPAVLYLSVVRKAIQPSTEIINRYLGRIFVLGEDNRLFIPESKRAAAKTYVDNVLPKMESLDDVTRRLKKYARDISEEDEFHRRLKEACSSRLFAGILCQKALQQNVTVEQFEERIGKLEESLDKAFENGDGGLVLIESAHKQVGEYLDQYDTARKVVPLVRKPAKTYADQIRGGDEVMDGWKKLLREDIVLIGFARQSKITETDPGKVLQKALTNAFEKTEDGEWRVIPDLEDQVLRGLQRISSQYRNQRRTYEQIEGFAGKLEDESLKAIYKSWYGRMAFIEGAQARLSLTSVDGLKTWIDRHFEKTDRGFRLREGREKDIHTFIHEVDRILRELEDDDFEKDDD